MPKYRKKPVVVEAIQWFKIGDHPKVQPFAANLSSPFPPKCHACGHYPCKPDIFEATYEVEDKP